jgi:hypothetical protein
MMWRAKLTKEKKMTLAEALVIKSAIEVTGVGIIILSAIAIVCYIFSKMD